MSARRRHTGPEPHAAAQRTAAASGGVARVEALRALLVSFVHDSVDVMQPVLDDDDDPKKPPPLHVDKKRENWKELDEPRAHDERDYHRSIHVTAR